MYAESWQSRKVVRGVSSVSASVLNLTEAIRLVQSADLTDKDSVGYIAAIWCFRSFSERINVSENESKMDNAFEMRRGGSRGLATPPVESIYANKLSDDKVVRLGKEALDEFQAMMMNVVTVTQSRTSSGNQP